MTSIYTLPQNKKDLFNLEFDERLSYMIDAFKNVFDPVAPILNRHRGRLHLRNTEYFFNLKRDKWLFYKKEHVYVTTKYYSLEDIFEDPEVSDDVKEGLAYHINVFR